MGKIDPNHDIVPTLRMMGGLLFDKAADEIDLLREAYRAAVRRPATELMVVGPGWHERFPVTTTPIVIDGLLQVHVSDRRDDMAAELARLRAENERLKAGARPYTVTCEPVIDRDWPEAHSVRIRNGGQRFDIGMHLETLEEAEHYATMLRVALGIDAAMTQGKL